VIADTSGIAFDPVDQIVGLSMWVGYADAREQMGVSLVDFQWTAESHPSQFYARQERAKVFSEASAYRADEPVRVAWQDIEEPKRLDWVGVFRAEGDTKQRLAFRFLAGASSGRMELPPLRVPGRYELRLFRDDKWDIVDVSERFEVR
jgi:hypothetical protein